jgi:folate-dependent phosphoribosylglycinamide formyltransferase PurN
LAARVLSQEHLIYPKVVAQLLSREPGVARHMRS